MAATCMACSAACSLCCCICQKMCGCGMSFDELVKNPPTTSDVQKFMKKLQPKADVDGESDVCCCCLPKSIVCCLPRCCCPCICPRPEKVSTVKNRDVMEIIEAGDTTYDNPSFLGEERAMKYVTRVFKSKDANECRMEFMSAGMVLLSLGTMSEKLQSLFESFSHAVGGVFNKEALERTVRSVLKTVIDISQRLADYLSGAALPGGKAVRLMLNTLNGTVGSFFVKNRVNQMLQRDLNDDGVIDYDEFSKVAMTKQSLIRKSIAWVDRKSAVVRGERPQDQMGNIKVNGQDVYARILDTEVEADECLEYWETQDDMGDKSKRLGVISLAEPCAIDDGTDDEDNVFIIHDKDKKQWTIECSDRDNFFEWYDAVDDRCDAKLEKNDLMHDPDHDDSAVCPYILG